MSFRLRNNFTAVYKVDFIRFFNIFISTLIFIIKYNTIILVIFIGDPFKMLVKTVVLVSGAPEVEGENITSEFSLDS